ncbi:MAG: hypothetical protein K9J13_10920 [Saprospiraceae bacterium]|nr:hypothetical protein [Saprospiraceae bacterium]
MSIIIKHTKNIDSMSAVKSQQTFNYLNNISYDKFGNRVIVNYGNGTSANYTYDSQTRRLSNLKSYDSQSNLMQDIDYDYDNAGNISGIENSATAINGLGGVYDYEYEYDSLYRLISSAGSFTDVNQTNYPFALDMTYSASGNISSKELTATTLLNGASTNIDYERNYSYNQNQPHTIESITDQLNADDFSMQWDPNGNMTHFNSSATGETRRMCWDEENRLAVVKDPNYASHYIYDAGGERTWKITGPIERMSINGGLYVDQTMLDYKTLYTSPYMVVSDAEYTKHFYAESQRVTTKLGGGFSPSLVDAHSTTLTPIVGNIQDIADGLWNYIYENTNCVDGEPDYISIASNLQIVEELFGSNNDESDLYFYHPDHLGSSSFISDVNGNVNQHLQYLPFGESFIDQQTNNNIRFTFSSKEKDSETGFGYFGARYYNSDISVWLSVDPLASKYPSMSSFMYCAGNPVMLVDPDGRKLKFAKYKDLTIEQKGGRTRKEYRHDKRIVKESHRNLRVNSNTGGIIVNDLRRDKRDRIIIATRNGESGLSHDNTTIIINVNYKMQNLEKESQLLNITILLAHELGHSWCKKYGLDLKQPTIDDMREIGFKKGFEIVDFVRGGRESNAVHIENRVRGELNLKLRDNYSGEIPPYYDLNKESKSFNYSNGSIYQDFGIVRKKRPFSYLLNLH